MVGRTAGRYPWCAVLMALLVGMVGMTGCTSGATSPEASPSPGTNAPAASLTPGPEQKSAAPPVDPQVLDDVVASAFPVPGREMRRNYRVDNFISDFSHRACGSKRRLSIDRTNERYSQDEFPDLDLIAEKGLVEPSPFTDKRGNPIPDPDHDPGCDGRSKGNLLDKLPAMQQVMGLSENPWSDVLATVEQEPDVVALKAPFARCLRAGTPGTGIVVSSEDPARTFLPQSDKAYVGNKITTTEREQVVPRLYATCGRPYFDAVQKGLEARRLALVERHRELLETFAGQLMALGYVP